MPKKKTYCGKEESGSRHLLRRLFSTSNFGPIFDLLNGIIWTSSPVGNLFKINFSSQRSLNNAIFMDGLKITG